MPPVITGRAISWAGRSSASPSGSSSIAFCKNSGNQNRQNLCLKSHKRAIFLRKRLFAELCSARTSFWLTARRACARRAGRIHRGKINGRDFVPLTKKSVNFPKVRLWWNYTTPLEHFLNGTDCLRFPPAPRLRRAGAPAERLPAGQAGSGAAEFPPSAAPSQKRQKVSRIEFNVSILVFSRIKMEAAKVATHREVGPLLVRYCQQLFLRQWQKHQNIYFQKMNLERPLSRVDDL